MDWKFSRDVLTLLISAGECDFRTLSKFFLPYCSILRKALGQHRIRGLRHTDEVVSEGMLLQRACHQLTDFIMMSWAHLADGPICYPGLAEASDHICVWRDDPTCVYPLLDKMLLTAGVQDFGRSQLPGTISRPATDHEMVSRFHGQLQVLKWFQEVGTYRKLDSFQYMIRSGVEGAATEHRCVSGDCRCRLTNMIDVTCRFYVLR